MGAVKTDIHKDFNKWGNITFADAMTVKGLLKNRLYFDQTYSEKITGIGDYYNSTNEIFHLYYDLDSLIDNCRFNNYQLKIIELYQKGYTEQEISGMVSVTQSAINQLIEKICRDIVNENNWERLKVLYKNIFNMYTVTCTGCGEELPVIDDFFYKDSRNSSGIKQPCKKCVSSKK